MTGPPAPGPDVGFGVRPGRDRAGDVDAAVAAYGARVGLAGVLEGLDRQGRRGFAPGLAARRALTWDAEDRRTRRWWPQGVTTSADAGRGPTGDAGAGLVVVSWYEKDRRGRTVGSRVSVLDLATRRYRHLRLVRLTVDGPDAGRPPRLVPLRVHAGGLAWRGDWLHVAATARGFWSCRWDDVLPGPDGDLVLPVGRSHAAQTRVGVAPMRYSFLSVEHPRASPGEAHLVAGEYNRARPGRRLVRYRLDEAGLPTPGPDGIARPVEVPDAGPPGMQGAVRLGAPPRWSVQTSRGPWRPGSLWTGPAGGTVATMRERRHAVPMGCEDLSHWPGPAPTGSSGDGGDGWLWSATEHPRRRWVYAVRPT